MLKKLFLLLAAGGALAALLVPCSVSAQNLVTNGDFEASNTTLTGWSGDGWGVDPNTFSLFGSAGGNFNAVTGAVGGPVFIQQILATVPGESYTLTYTEASSGGTPNEVLAQWGGVTVNDDVNFDPSNGSTLVVVSDLVAGSSTTELAFGGFNNPGGVFLDNISVVATVPEPATCALLAGLGVLGLAVRRRDARRTNR